MFILRKLSFWGALLGLLATVWMVQRTTRITPLPDPPVAPASKPSPDSIGAAGIVEALRENTSIGVPAGGLVKRVPVCVWDQVQAGDILFELDDREFVARLRSEEAELRVQEAEFNRLRRQSERTQALHADRLVPDEEADHRRDELAVQEARLGAARAAILGTQTLLERLVVRAPVAGTVLQVNTRVGEYVVAGAPTPPVLLGAISELQVRAEVDEQIASQVRPGQPALGYLKGDSSRPIEMEFVRIEPFVIPKRNLTGASAERVDTRVLQVIYKFANAHPLPIYVGQQMDLYLPR
jgi:RND family efflux transporter MFP subunit